jgi:hypothetical protein
MKSHDARLLLLFVAFVFGSAHTVAENATTTGTLDLKAAIEGLAYQASYTGDANTNNTATVQYRKTGSGTWLNAYIVINGTLINPFNDRRATINGVTNPYYHQFRGSIVGLQPGTSYDVRVIYSDRDGVTGGPALTGTISTAATTPPTGATIQVSNNTDWANALSNSRGVSAGKHVHVNASGGPYKGGLSFTASGTVTSYTVLDCDASTPAHIRGSGVSYNLEINADYVVVKDCIFDASDTNGLRLASGRHHDIYIQNNTFAAIDSSCSITSDTFPAGIDLSGGGTNLWVLNNTIHGASALASCNTQIDGNATGSHIVIEAAGSGSITNATIMGNRLDGVLSDGITQNSGGTNNMHLENIEVIGNAVQDYRDDGIEFKAMSINNRAVRNTVIANHATTCFAANSNLTNGQSYGPVYFARNNCHYFTDTNPGAVWKIGNSSNSVESLPLLIFHNSVYENVRNIHDVAHFDCEGGGLQTVYFINNIFYGQGNYLEKCSRYGEPGASLGASLWDYNDVYTCCNSIGYNLHNFSNSAPDTFSNWKAEGPNEDPHGFSSPTFPYVSTTDLHLVVGSVAIDKGVILANFNDANSAWPYSGTAPDVGAFEFPSSPPPPPRLISH